MSFFSSKFHVCKVLSVNTFLRIMFFFHYVSFESFELSSFEKCYRTGVRCYICNLCCTHGSGCLYIILCRTALNICGIHLRSNNIDNICLYSLQLRLLDTSFFVVFFFFFFVARHKSLDDSWKISGISMN